MMKEHIEKKSGAARILIVEDSEVQAIALKRLLEGRGYDVTHAIDGAQGLAMARTLKPELIITDIRMPVMDGFQMAREIKSDAHLCSIPIILLTQLIGVDEVIDGLNSGAENYVTKPYDEQYLLERVDVLLNRPEQFWNNPETRSIDFTHNGRCFSIKAGRAQSLGFLVSTYENAVIKNRALAKAQVELEILNEGLESMVKERTSELTAEVQERRRVEASLRESEERYRKLFDSMLNGFAVHEAIKGPDGRPVDSRFVSINPAFERYTGLKAEDITGRAMSEVMADDGEDWFKPYAEVMGAGRPMHFEWHRKESDRHYDILSYRLDETHFAVLLDDITERKKAQDALTESEERFKAIVSAASDAVICLEPPDNIYIWNRKAEEIFGYSAKEAVGRGLHDLIVPERYRGDAKAAMGAFIRTGAGSFIGKTVELTALRSDGSEFPVELSIAAVNIRGGWNSIGIIRDITDRKRLEEEAKENLSDVERMNRLMVGRELRMEELRQRARELEARLKTEEEKKAG